MTGNTIYNHSKQMQFQASQSTKMANYNKIVSGHSKF